MKKILFVVGTHGNELAGLKLFVEYPYGKTNYAEWSIIIGNPNAVSLNQKFIETDLNNSFDTPSPASYEEQRAEILKKRFSDYDVVYDIHTTSTIRPVEWDDCMFVNNIDTKTLTACSYANAKHIIWERDTAKQKQYLTSHHPCGIRLEYQKTDDVRHDYMRIKTDFMNIIYQKSSYQTPKHLYEADRVVSQEERMKYQLTFEDFHPLTTQEKKLLDLNVSDMYVPVFVNPKEADPQNYCFLNKKLRDVITFEAWLGSICQEN